MLRRLTICVLVCGLWNCARSAIASFHLWDIREIYSNADGSVQFIELFTTANSQQFTNGTMITTDANTFVFPSNTPSPTANHRLLLATAGFELLPGGVTPDFNIPANFFNPATDFINYVGADSVSAFNTPTDGLNSAFFPGNVTGTNSPTNFAGDIGKLVTLGDMNEDGVVDANDSAPLVLALVDPSGFAVAHPTVDTDLVGDVNEDGQFDLGDIAEFELLINSSSSAEANGAPEPSTLVCALVSFGLLLARARRHPRHGRRMPDSSR